MHMAMIKQLTGKSLKVLNNYGTVDGKVVTKTKSYARNWRSTKLFNQIVITTTAANCSL